MERLSIKNALRFLALMGTLLLVVTVVAAAFGSDASGKPAWSILISCVVVASALMFGFAFHAGAHFARRAESIVNALHHIAEGDLTQKLKISGKDDFSWLAYEYDTARKSLVQLINEINAHSASVSDSAANLAEASTRISSSTAQQTEAASSIAAAVQEMAVSVSQVADNAKEARQLTNSARELSHQGTTVIGNVVTEVGHIAHAVQESSTAIAELGRQSAQIRMIIKVIDEVAEQTNLLALNAAIEAARAGEQGRGFAVVADEVRKLAERTASSTKEIGTMIEAIGKGTTQTVASMEQGVAKVESGVSLAREAGSAIKHIDDSAQKVAVTVNDMSSAIEEQRSVANEIARHVDSIAQMAEGNNVATQQTGETAKRLAGLAADLGKAVSRFKV